nr:hypothetical protein [Tanacetum cinerariifolium]
AVVAKVSTSSSTSAVSSEVAELKDLVRALLLDKRNQSSAPASSSTPTPVKAVEPSCVTCGVKQVNDVTRLQALVDKKKVVVIKATIREALCLDDAEEQQGDEEEDAEENIEEVNAGDAAEGDDSAAHGEVPTVAEEQSLPSPTPPTPPPQSS